MPGPALHVLAGHGLSASHAGEQMSRPSNMSLSSVKM